MKPIAGITASLLIFLIASPLQALQRPGQPGIELQTAGMQKFAGYFPLYWDSNTGKLWLEIDRWGTEFLYAPSLATGLGFREVGLDRGRLPWSEGVVEFRRVGPKILLVQRNYRFRGTTANPEEIRAVEESFTQSVLWAFDVAAEEGSRVLVDASAFLLRDVIDVPAVLRRNNQGTYKLEPSRSVIHLPRTKNFPQNTEVETILTFVSDDPGPSVREVAPEPRALTVRQHHSFAELPDNKFTLRFWHPRSGLFPLQFLDFTAPLNQPMIQRLAYRHRLQKVNPRAAVSKAVKPIIYYVDSAIPEPLRSAVVEGASWWREAFRAAGYEDGFQVKLLPGGVDPLDIRYNVIEWIHRLDGRSPSYDVSDPRTGEIIKGHVTLASPRVRQHYLLGEALLAPYGRGKHSSADVEVYALARLRQVAAHEVGHALGLQHNFAASVTNYASVMDYPHPLVHIMSRGEFDLSRAYTTGVGEWDKLAIAYAYQEFGSAAEENRGLREILKRAGELRLHYVLEGREPAGTHPLASMYDHGQDAVEGLKQVLRVRNLALERVSEASLREGALIGRLEELAVPLYFFHQHQIHAVAKLLGGIHYTYNVRGDPSSSMQIVPAADQERALDALAGVLAAESLALPERVLELISPLPPDSRAFQRVVPRRTGVSFDALMMPEALAHLTVRAILDPGRAARIVEHHSRNGSSPSLATVMDRLIDATWKTPRRTSYAAEVGRVADVVVVYNLMDLAANEDAAIGARSVALLKLGDLAAWIEQRLGATSDDAQKAHLAFATLQIKRFLAAPTEPTYPKPVNPPTITDWELPWIAW